jgi:alpha-mannosidase
MITSVTRKTYIENIEQFRARLHETVVAEDQIPMTAKFALTKEHISFKDRKKLKYRDIREGERYGGSWENAWFNLKAKVPSSWKGALVMAEINIAGEGLVFGSDGTPLQGLTTRSVMERPENAGRTLFPLCARAKGGEKADLWVDAAAHALFGISGRPNIPHGNPARYGTYDGQVVRIRLVKFDSERWQLCMDVDTLLSLAQGLPEDDVRAARVLEGLKKVVEVLAADEKDTSLARGILKPLLKSPAGASACTAHSVGHAHLDVGWLWPVKESRRKAARTFASQLSLIEKYPGYIFGASQPVLYTFVKEDYPKLYSKVKKAVKQGSWETQGATWVEMDCNVTGGESLVRQFLHGKNFFMEEFGVDVKNLFIPDVFGYSAALPQICKRAGVDYFITQKLSWNQFNLIPFHTFVWKGVDGSKIVTHFPPNDTYNSSMNPREMISGQNKFKEKGILNDYLVLFGIGDGGAGPKATHIEKAIRQKNLEGCPRVKFSKVSELMPILGAKAEKLHQWTGELYFERHRGTLTTHSRIKRGNRKMELALRQAEYLCSCAGLRSYPLKELDALWKMVLTNQFHDIIPGSSINLVNVKAEKDYAEGLKACEAITARAVAKLMPASRNSITFVNTLSTAFKGAVELPGGWKSGLKTIDGVDVPVQVEADGAASVLLSVQPQSSLTLKRAGNPKKAAKQQDLVLENDVVRYRFNRDGQVVEAYDKQERRGILAKGAKGNVVTMYEDRPLNWDAWDIDLYYREQVAEAATGTAVRLLGKGGARQGIEFTLKIGKSRLVQKVYLAEGSKRLDFVSSADWCEKHKLLRTSFRVDVESEHASFDIQYAYLERNTHANTSWEEARFEVAGQRYADISDNQYGVALLNDCKYGYYVRDNILDLALLRAPTSPDPDADEGAHQFTYSLLPHSGALIGSDVMGNAACLNQPPLVVAGRDGSSMVPPVTVEGQGVSLEVVKKAEKEDCLVIRLVETRGCRTTARIRTAGGNATVTETDLLEWRDLSPVRGGRVQMKPFEIRTFKIRQA